MALVCEGEYSYVLLGGWLKDISWAYDSRLSAGRWVEMPGESEKGCRNGCWSMREKNVLDDILGQDCLSAHSQFEIRQATALGCFPSANFRGYHHPAAPSNSHPSFSLAVSFHPWETCAAPPGLDPLCSVAPVTSMTTDCNYALTHL